MCNWEVLKCLENGGFLSKNSGEEADTNGELGEEGQILWDFSVPLGHSPGIKFVIQMSSLCRTGHLMGKLRDKFYCCKGC